MKNLREKIKPYIAKGLVTERKHPTENLWVYNYTQKCSYEKLWDETTLMCRGLVLDKYGNIVAKPFPKFFNYGETCDTSSPETYFQLPKICSEKIDGSLGILFCYHDKWFITTRGSFESDQAIEALKILYSDINLLALNSYKDYTILCEIVYPENRIVCDYGQTRALYFLNIVPDNIDEEISLYSFLHARHVFKLSGFLLPEIFDYTIEFCQNHIINGPYCNKEGFVFEFENPKRIVKLKYKEYFERHKIVTNLTEHTVWAALKAGNAEFVINTIPDEYFKWFDDVLNTLNSKFYFLDREYKDEFKKLMTELPSLQGTNNVANSESSRRAFFAEQVKKLQAVNGDSDFAAIMFKLYDNKSINEILFKIIKPVKNA